MQTRSTFCCCLPIAFALQKLNSTYPVVLFSLFLHNINCLQQKIHSSGLLVLLPRLSASLPPTSQDMNDTVIVHSVYSSSKLTLCIIAVWLADSNRGLKMEKSSFWQKFCPLCRSSPKQTAVLTLCVYAVYVYGLRHG